MSLRRRESRSCSLWSREWLPEWERCLEWVHGGIGVEDQEHVLDQRLYNVFLSKRFRGSCGPSGIVLGQLASIEVQS